MDEQTVKAIQLAQEIINALIKYFGPTGTLGIIALGYIIFSIAPRLYADYRKDREINLALEEKEKSIQRLANDNRNWRAIFLKEKLKWSDEEIERLIITNSFENPKEAREHLLSRNGNGEKKGGRK
jgi:hypothetical protein